MDITNACAFITGASDGIGKEVALKLAQKNVSLALIGRNTERLDHIVQEATKLGSKKAKSYTCDIRKTSELEQVIPNAIEDFKQIPILINIAGIWQKLNQLENISASVVDDVIQTNLTSMIHCIRIFLPHLKSLNEAIIINVSSKSGFTAQEGQTVYTASKWGVRGLTETLKADLAKTNIRVAGVYQSGTNTKMFEKTGENFPVETFTNPTDLADVIVQMVSMPKKIWLHEVRVEF